MIVKLSPNQMFEYHSVWYKIGIHGKVFKLIDNHWIASTIPVEVLNRAYNGYVRRGCTHEGY